jgi:hypothetical protein
MSLHAPRVGTRLIAIGLCALAALALPAPAAFAAKIKMVFPGPATSFGLPL